MLSTALIGFLMGVGGSIPLAGPITMLILGYGLEGRIRQAALVALGSALPESIYAALALWGFGALVDEFKWVGPTSHAIAVLVLLGVGLFLILRPPSSNESSAGTSTEGEGAKRHLLLGLSITALNPALIFNWGAAVTMIYSLGLVEPKPQFAIPFGLGVGTGILSWFTVVLYFLHRHHKRISPKARENLMKGMGILLFGLGLLAAARALINLA
jgi:threonine/homoserine/homoserine lactone efflux protein